MVDRAYWKERAKTYNNLDWVRHRQSLELVIKHGQFKSDDLVLDIGTGNGVLATAIAPFVEQVIGIDVSNDMLSIAKRVNNVHYLQWDVHKPLFDTGIFNKIIMRQFLHHIPADKLDTVMHHCNKWLVPGGKLIIVEPICVTELFNEYSTIFELKDNRIVFTLQDIKKLLRSTGFILEDVVHFRINDFSVRNWLSNNALDKATQNKIYDMHVSCSPLFREKYNVRVVDSDCLIDTHNVVMIGSKR